MKSSLKYLIRLLLSLSLVVSGLYLFTFDAAARKTIYKCGSNVFTDAPYRYPHIRCEVFIKGDSVNFRSRNQIQYFSFKRPSKKILSIVKEASKRYNVPVALILAVINAESGFDPYAVSPKGAMGLMQLMPETVKLLQIKDPFDINENILGGTKYLRILIDKFGNDARKILAAYNAGPNVIERYSGVPPYPETITYIKKVISGWKYYKKRMNLD